VWKSWERQPRWRNDLEVDNRRWRVAVRRGKNHERKRRVTATYRFDLVHALVLGFACQLAERLAHRVRRREATPPYASNLLTPSLCAVVVLIPPHVRDPSDRARRHAPNGNFWRLKLRLEPVEIVGVLRDEVRRGARKDPRRR
jgi:hypothetical protein